MRGLEVIGWGCFIRSLMGRGIVSGLRRYSLFLCDLAVLGEDGNGRL
jgi:hypothetical protein